MPNVAPTSGRVQGSCPSGMVTNINGWACVALVPTKSLYLPGWYMGAYRVITEDAQRVWWGGCGYILRAVPERPVPWQPYTVGDPLPSAAVTASTWKDGTPLYFVTQIFGGNFPIGYLLPSVQRTFIMKGGSNPYSPTNVHTRVYA